MTDILCDEVNCIWYKDEECDAGKIVCFCDGWRTFQDYMDLPEYQCEYWEAIVRKSKKDIVRKRRKGKEVMVNGVKFYTRDNMKWGERCIYLTDARTGIMVGDMKTLKERWDWYIDAIKKHRDVMEFPEVEGARDEDVIAALSSKGATQNHLIDSLKLRIKRLKEVQK